MTDCKKLASNEKEETDKKRPNLWIEINDADEIQLILPKLQSWIMWSIWMKICLLP